MLSFLIAYEMREYNLEIKKDTVPPHFQIRISFANCINLKLTVYIVIVKKSTSYTEIILYNHRNKCCVFLAQIFINNNIVNLLRSLLIENDLINIILCMSYCLADKKKKKKK